MLAWLADWVRRFANLDDYARRRADLTGRVGTKGALSQRLANLDVVFGVEPIPPCCLRLAMLGMLAPRAKGLVRLELDDRDSLAIVCSERLVRDEAGNRPGEIEHPWEELAELSRRLGAKTGPEDDHRHLMTLHRPRRFAGGGAPRRLCGLLLRWGWSSQRPLLLRRKHDGVARVAGIWERLTGSRRHRPSTWRRLSSPRSEP